MGYVSGVRRYFTNEDRYMPNKLQLYNKICRQCNKPLTATSKIQVVHAECRIEYYQGIGKKKYETTLMNWTRVRTGIRQRWFINEYPCEVCGYLLMTKAKRFYSITTSQVQEHYLCPTHLMEWRAGFLEALTWKKLDIETRENRQAPQASPQAPSET